MSVLHEKNFGKTWGLSRPSSHISADSRPIPAANKNLKFQKYEIFAIFEQILDFFFSNVRMLSKIVSNEKLFFFSALGHPEDKT